MSLPSLKIFIPLLFLILVPLISGDGELPPQWCVVDVQTPDDVLIGATNWACGGDGGADCSMIQENQPCYFPNTPQNHASYAFNSYFQKFKHQGASCYFNGAAIVTDLDPSYGNCHFESLP
ncbi:glucan endo-1,3-beta-glucosidase 4-like [Silene latifolia]|uniref:glucan endo-1,3-beta-glucosidase 4-like n=1 Tax=Silene latifolia TaxID=37657 RepID=UPI003D76E022